MVNRDNSQPASVDEQLVVREQTRRHFFGNAGLSIGSLGLAGLLSDGQLTGSASAAVTRPGTPGSPQTGHFPARAKRVIYLFMAGGPSQLELFDYKPKLQQMDGQVIPASYVENKRFAFIKKDAKLLGTRRQFLQWGDSGQQISSLLPHLPPSCVAVTALPSFSAPTHAVPRRTTGRPGPRGQPACATIEREPPCARRAREQAAACACARRLHATLHRECGVPRAVVLLRSGDRFMQMDRCQRP